MSDGVAGIDYRLKMKTKATIFALLLCLMSCNPQSGTAPESGQLEPEPMPQGPYLGQTPGNTPTIFAPGFISTNLNELNGNFGPEGKAFFFSLDAPRGDFATILHTTMDASGTWSEVKIAPFSGKFSDVDPVFSPQGNQIYFCSDRPRPSDSTRKDFDIWRVDREGDAWKEPLHLGNKLNTPRNDWYCSSTRDGTLYYSTWDPERNTDDIFSAAADDGYEPVNIGGGVNTGSAEFDPFISPDESYLLFSSYRRSGHGNADLYISFKVDGEWSEAQNLGEKINSSGKDYCPWVSTDGKYLFFTSMRTEKPYHEMDEITLPGLRKKMLDIDNGMGNVYWVKADFLQDLRPQD